MSFATYNVNAMVDAKALTMAATAAPDTPDSGYVTIFTDASERVAWKKDNGFVAAINTPITQDTVYTMPSGAASYTMVDTTVTTLSSLASVGTITTGVWNASVIGPTYGGTGVNNGSNTITLGGNISTAGAFSTSGANALTLTTTGATNVTLPTTGTLVNDQVATLSNLSSIGTITTGTWNASTITVPFGGTGATTLAAGGVLYGNGVSAIGASTGTSGQLLVSGGSGAPTWSGTITYASNKLTGLAAPTANSDAANKQYVDEAVAGLSWKQAAKASTTANLTAVYNNGTGGVGATLTGTGALPTIDGVTLVANDRLLVKDQTDQKENGIYTVTTLAPNWVITRSTDADNSPNNELNSAAIFVTQGTAGANKSWTQTTPDVTLGTDNVVWSQFAGTNTYTASQGVTLVGNDFRIASPLITTYGGTGFGTYTAGDLLYGNGGSTLSKLAAGTATQVLHGGATPSWSAVSLTADVTGTLPIANGGTNSSAALNNNRIMVSSSGQIVEAAALTNGQLLIGSTGAAPVAANVTGTTNQVIVTNGAGSITLSLPQDIHTAATPTFASQTLTATTNQLTLGTTNTTTISSVAPAASRTYTIPDAGGAAEFVMTAGTQTITGNKALSGTISFPALTASKPLQLTAGNNVIAQDVSLTSQVSGVLPIANGGTATGATPSNGQLLIGNGTNYTLSTLTAGSGVTITNGAGSISIAADGASQPQVMTFFDTQFTVGNTTAATIAFLPHQDSRFGAFATRRVSMWVVPGNTARNLTVSILPNGGASLGGITVNAGGAAGIQTFTFTDPGADTRLDFRVVRSAGAGTNPIIYGATLEYL